MKNYLTILGGVALAVAMFLPFATVIGMSASVWDGGSKEVYIWLGCAVALIVCGFLGKKPLNYLSLILGLAAVGMAIKYKIDMGNEGVTAGIGVWIMLGGGALAIIGSLMGLMKKTP